VRLYADVLGRLPDENGLAYWQNNLLNGTFTGATVTQGFFYSTEYLSKDISDAEFIATLYDACLNRAMDASELPYWQNMLDNGCSRLCVLNQFTQSREFTGLCDSYGITTGQANISEPADVNPWLTMFVNRLYKTLFGWNGDRDGLNYWTNLMLNQGWTGAKAADGFVYSDNFQTSSLTDAQYISTLYIALLGIDSDQSGLDYWQGVIDRSGTSAIGRRAVFDGFVASQNFKDMCEAYGIKAN